MDWVSDPTQHISVLAREVCRALGPSLARAGESPRGILVDATCGLGGHIRALLVEYRPARVIAFDRDCEALAIARENLRQAPCAIEFVHSPFSGAPQWLRDRNVAPIAALLADLGVSSLQLDRQARGFSWRFDAPLDMRMDTSRGTPLAERLATMTVSDLARVLREYGEEPEALRIARALAANPPQTTLTLAETVANAMSAPARRKLGARIHPATRTFQALRIYINAELDELETLLELGPELLEVGGKMAIISFHSLEDRLVKRRFASLARGPTVPPGVPLRAQELPSPRFAIVPEFARGVTPTSQEATDNPRARSARLRVLERIAR